MPSNDYLKSQHKRQKEYNNHFQKIAHSYKNGDLVGISINKVDRTNCDPKTVPCIIEKCFDKSDMPMYQLLSQVFLLHGIRLQRAENCFSARLV